MGKTYKIAVIGGDGTGPEVVREGVKVLKAVTARFGFKLEFADFNFGGATYLRTGEVLPNNAVSDLKTFDAIFLGAIGHPDVKPGILEKGILLRLRFELDQYINLRPVKLFPGVETPIKGKGPEDIDFIVVRENSQDLYSGMGGLMHEGTPNEVATQTSIYSRFGVDRCLKYAFDLTKKRHANSPWKGLSDKDRADGKTGQLTLVGKTNVLTYVYGLWERAFHELGAKEFPEVKRNYHHVDACCMYMVRDPDWYDVIVTGNMFGDIITDLGAMIQGGLGIAAGGNINPDPGGVSMFEPIGGTAPQFTGLNSINPLAAILSGQMMLAHLGENNAAAAIERAVKKTAVEKMKSQAAGMMGCGTTDVGDFVAQFVADGI